MNNQAAQTMPELPESPFQDGYGRGEKFYTAEQMHDMYQRGYADGLSFVCQWPDCGHDTNQVDPRPGCNGAYCHKRIK